ncbi:hypothetical protein [Caulobacter sp. 1776]|uniref:hypothetical protein n=1 Tax=Caulobacter sp. 1776 TaxID=3156420 RepID=UPI0033918B75
MPGRPARFAADRGLGLLAAFSVFLLSRPYPGVYHDGRLYIADALAKLDPAGVGQDLMFVHDGQFGFSLYTPILARLIAMLGPSGGTMAIVVLTLTLWFAAAALLVERLLADRPPAVRWAALMLIVALPPSYGPLNALSYAEPYATPRGLAEAAGLAGMAAYLSGRRILGLAACAAGMLFHPIMGLCSAAAIGLALCLEDRRWLWAALAGLALAALAGLLRLPFADRIVTVMEPAWRAVVERRSPIVFPSQWPVETWSLIALHLCSLAAGAALLRDAPRRLAVGALAAGLLGVAVSALLGERLSLLLFLQMQTWRALQPAAVLAAASMALLCAELPRRGPLSLWGLALLGVAWIFREASHLALIVAPIGLLCVLWGQRIRLSRPALIGGAAVCALAAAAIAYGALRVIDLAGALAAMPSAWPFGLVFVWASDLPSLLVGLMVGAGLAWGWRPAAAFRIVGVAALCVLALALWDDRSPFVRERDQGRDAVLTAMTASRPGAVLWMLGDVEPWMLMGRPSWTSRLQSAGVVFSRPLALELKDRARRLIASGLVEDDWLTSPRAAIAPPPPPRLASVRAFCAAPDAPAWIVWAYWKDAVLEPGLKARDWTPRRPFTQVTPNGWLTASRYAVIPCAGD